MMQVMPKSHEQRIADLERELAEIKRIVGVPGPLAGLSHVGLPNAAADAAQASLAYRNAVAASQAMNAQKAVWGGFNPAECAALNR